MISKSARSSRSQRFRSELSLSAFVGAVADPGEGGEGPLPGPVKISSKKDGRQIRLHRFHVSRRPSTRPLDPLLRCQLFNEVFTF